MAINYQGSAGAVSFSCSVIEDRFDVMMMGAGTENDMNWRLQFWRRHSWPLCSSLSFSRFRPPHPSLSSSQVKSSQVKSIELTPHHQATPGTAITYLHHWPLSAVSSPIKHHQFNIVFVHRSNTSILLLDPHTSSISSFIPPHPPLLQNGR